ncbi:MAG: Glu/Leu/Phe/Val dehydrogenase dimerization domain-containing protein [Acidimicrobiia bacterium]
MGSVTDVMLERGHEQVVFVADRPSGLRAVIAVHSTALGPSLGGVRFWHYGSDDEAVADVLRLSEAMTLKAAAAGLHQGGGKAVVQWDDPDRARPEALLRALGRAIHELGGRYLAAEDVGATQRDMDLLALETPWVTGVDPALGGSGDPSPVTAFGVVCAMRAALRRVFGDRDLEGRSVVVQGCGHVGSHVARLLVAAGAKVTVADLHAPRVEAVVQELGVSVADAAGVLYEPCDVLAPCALGGVLSLETAEALQCRAVVGAANNQLAEDGSGGAGAVDDALAARGILYAPDFVANAGGIINIAEEFTGYSRDRAIRAVARIESRVDECFTMAAAEGVSPGRAAELLARRRLAAEALPRGRWQPGDPAAWTDGAPLRALRSPVATHEEAPEARPGQPIAGGEPA